MAKVWFGFWAPSSSRSRTQFPSILAQRSSGPRAVGWKKAMWTWLLRLKPGSTKDGRAPCLVGREGLGAASAEARTGASVTAAYTALCRAEWALARVASGPGALAGKYRHPAVAPYLRSLQRLFPQLEALL